jgi:glycosyltransferase involved in cell wall biosynthesis
MRVCHVITGLDTGGAEVMLQKLVAATVRDGVVHNVVSLTSRGAIGASLDAAGVPVHALGMRRGVPDVRAIASLRRRLSRERPQVVQTWMYHANLVGGLAARLAGIRPVVWNIRASRLDPATEKRGTIWVARGSARAARLLCRRIVTNSEEALRVHERMGYPAALFVVIPNGFDLGVFRPDGAARASLRAELGLPPGAVLIGMVSRFHRGKDHGTFLAAAARLGARRPDVHFVLAGEGVSTDNDALLQHTRGGLEGRVSLLGRRADTPRLFAALDISTLTSTYESFPNVVGEAMACAVPCVVTDVGDARAIVGDTGVVVPPREPEALVEAWCRLLDLDAGSRRTLGARARERIAEHYSIASVAARYVRLYEDVAGE